MRVGELLGALSLATDLAAGVPLETSLRTALVADGLARRLGFDVLEARRVALLRHLGCTAYAHEAARIAGDDHAMLATFAGVDLANRPAVVGRTVGRLGRGQGAGRVATLARALANPRAGRALVAAQCAQAAALAEDLGLPAAVVEALGQIYARHDGDMPVRPSASVLHVAELAEIWHRTRGRDTALAEVSARRGKHLAPDVVDAFVAEPPWELLEAPSVWDRYVDADEPDDPSVDRERIAVAFGRYADLKSPAMLGHSTAVAELAVAASGVDGERVRVAALLHDLGIVSVPNGIWDKPGPLNAAEWERVRLHGYYTQRILAQSPLLADVAAIAGGHHERLDGSGYHRAVNAAMLDDATRVIAAADAYCSMAQPRSHRAARTREAIADALAEDVRTGKLCGRAVDAVLGAAGHVRRERALPAGLTAREVEVLVELARGRTNKEIAHSLGIAVRTANHHVEHIYEKIGVTTRAAAALFAVRNDLVSA